MRVADGWLVPSAKDDPVIVRTPTSRTQPYTVPGPLAVVWHWTGSGVDDNRGHRDSEALARWIADPDSDARASWHVLIDRDGTVIQSAPTTVGTQHVGRTGRIRGMTRGVNGCTVGIELENLGELRGPGDYLAAWPFDGKAPRVPAARAKKAADGRFFDTYTTAQEKSAEAVLRALVLAYSWPREACTYGHVDFDSPRKQDPGPLWLGEVLPRILDRIYVPSFPSAPAA